LKGKKGKKNGNGEQDRSGGGKKSAHQRKTPGVTELRGTVKNPAPPRKVQEFYIAPIKEGGAENGKGSKNKPRQMVPNCLLKGRRKLRGRQGKIRVTGLTESYT